MYKLFFADKNFLNFIYAHIMRMFSGVIKNPGSKIFIYHPVLLIIFYWSKPLNIPLNYCQQTDNSFNISCYFWIKGNFPVCNPGHDRAVTPSFPNLLIKVNDPSLPYFYFFICFTILVNISSSVPAKLL